MNRGDIDRNRDFWRTRKAKSLLRDIFDSISLKWTARLKDKDAIVALYTHGILLDEKEAALNHVYPEAQRGFTKEALRIIIQYFLQNGYEFITPSEIIEKSSIIGKFVMLTFDDGYFSNSHALSLLKEFKCPATFFISTRNILEGKAYWWDIIYRERARRGVTTNEIRKEIRFLRSRKVEEIDQYIYNNFGDCAHRPISDTDRPFTINEIRDLAKCQYFHVGNHTHNHSLLSKLPEETIRKEIETAQWEIKEMTGILPIGISYPSGLYDERVVRISAELGLKVGMTIWPHKNYLPIDASKNELMRLGRYEIDLGRDLIWQLDVIRSDFQPYFWLKNRQIYIK